MTHRLRHDLQALCLSESFRLDKEGFELLLGHAYAQGGDIECISQLLDTIDAGSVKLWTADMIRDLLGGTASGQHATEMIQVINAFDVPRVRYEPIRKAFYCQAEQLSLHGGPQDKQQVYLDRMYLLQQRLRRNPMFSKPVFDNLGGTSRAFCELTELKALLGLVGQTRYVMGCISQLEDGRFFLEDLSASVPLDITEAATVDGFVTENCIVVAEGKLQHSGVFKVEALGFPPLEPRAESQAAAKGIDFFGGQALRGEELVKALDWEMAHENDRIIIMSDVWLDKPETLDSLHLLLTGYEMMENVPSLFVLMGNFQSYSCASASTDYTAIRENFSSLAAALSQHRRIKQSSHFVLVPGPGDPGPASVLPRPGLPAQLTADLAQQLPRVSFASNPCRIRFGTQELVFFRDNLQNRMRRLCLLPPKGEDKSPERMHYHLSVTLLQQSHLCPVPMDQQAIYWQYDHALHLYPAPDVLVVADAFKATVNTFQGCVCINSGSLANKEFAAYVPALREGEPCELPEEDDL
ncbi:hypothetical protein WJX72_001491 [[Myrmecia] bisecta]|uniref:DNA polymerase epsilon subunit n=1 Tax=[Myrmecia] bisecta TaxID=41462 RepID=A0AAW1PWJ6_9CHLO